jgi:hypothetical protein
MDIYTIIDLVDPQTLGKELQSGVDSLAGRHVNMTSVEVLLDTIDSIDIVK